MLIQEAIQTQNNVRDEEAIEEENSQKQARYTLNKRVDSRMDCNLKQAVVKVLKK